VENTHEKLLHLKRLEKEQTQSSKDEINKIKNKEKRKIHKFKCWFFDRTNITDVMSLTED
jgi:hypothetical protein